MGAKILLTHFHYVNKGRHPFSMVLQEKGLQEVVRDANLDTDQIQFIRNTAVKVAEKGMGEY